METAVGEVVEATDSDAVVPACALVAPCVPEEPFALEAFALPSVPELSVLLCALEALLCTLFASALEEPSAVAMAALSVSETGFCTEIKGRYAGKEDRRAAEILTFVGVVDDSGLSILQVIIAQLGIQIGKGERIRKENFRIRVDRKDVGLIERICEQVAVFYLIGGVFFGCCNRRKVAETVIK